MYVPKLALLAMSKVTAESEANYIAILAAKVVSKVAECGANVVPIVKKR